MSITFTRAGLQTSIQDSGRPGQMHYGIPLGGAADVLSMKLANLLLGNPLNNPVLEITLIGPRIEFDCDISIVITGAQFKVFLNKNPVDNFKTIQVEHGDILDFSKLNSGARSYIGFSAKISVPRILKSAATHLISNFGGRNNGAIKDGDTLYFENSRIAKNRQLEQRYQPIYTTHPQLRVVDGPERNTFTQETIENFFNTTYDISAQSNRMGIRLTPSITPTSGVQTETSEQMISSGLLQGSIQIPPNGEPIISFIEGQTIGGYPRIANVIRADLHRLGQLKARDRVNFQIVSLAQANRILREKQHFLEQVQERIATETKEALTL
ncbi:biotin-dependent carboxyltransferase family protein [Microbulbifer epialgicus]|uniref:Biotin-dependent carboxyltransferase family protein n=1 Tax=Microbulbifer epialgicus TaxID=393907 RepID=A0ABV4NXS2_9GAMM